MKKILILLSLLFCGVAHADTIDINWRVGDSVYDTSSCTVGGDLNVPTPPTKYGYTFRGWKPKYTRIEYLESTGTQYIDTQMFLNSDYTVEVKGIINCGTVVVAEEGAGYSPMSGMFSLFVACGSGYSVWGYTPSSCTNGVLGINSTDVFTIKINKYGIYTNGVKKVNFNLGSDTVYSTNKFLLFSSKDPSYGWSSNKLYYVKIYDNDVLVRDFVPVLDPDGVPCMYDTVSATCFYNAGTGNFIAGPVV